jgi:hypothetical protein
LTRSQAHALLAEAEKRITGLVNLPHGRSLRVAEQFAVSAYDARFLGAAQISRQRWWQRMRACAKRHRP